MSLMGKKIKSEKNYLNLSTVITIVYALDLMR